LPGTGKTAVYCPPGPNFMSSKWRLRSCPNFGSSLCGLCVSVPLWLIIAQESSPQRHRDTEVAQRRIQIRTPLPGLVRYKHGGEQSGTEYRSEGELL